MIRVSAFIVSILLCLNVLSIYGSNLPTTKSDTTRPLDLLASYFSNPQNDNVSHYYKRTLDFHIDSLIFHVRFSEEEKEQLNYFRELNKLNENDFLYLIDSILDTDIIPNSLRIAIDYCLAYLYNTNDTEEDLICESISSYELFPASDIYQHIWCHLRPNPYPIELIENDSLIVLKLIWDTLDFTMPCIAPVTSKYGWRDGRMHHGIDLGINYALPIHSAFSGTVRFAKFYQGYGRLIIIRHDNGLETFYAHLSRIRVKPGQRVNAGDIIGNAGNSGRSFGTHLHFEIRYKGIPINPAHLISFNENKLLYEKISLKKIKTQFFVYNENAILYTVQKGDYLHKIATEYGTTVNKLCEINDISRNTKLRVGQILRVLL